MKAYTNTQTYYEGLILTLAAAESDGQKSKILADELMKARHSELLLLAPQGIKDSFAKVHSSLRQHVVALQEGESTEKAETAFDGAFQEMTSLMRRDLGAKNSIWKSR